MMMSHLGPSSHALKPFVLRGASLVNRGPFFVIPISNIPIANFLHGVSTVVDMQQGI